MSTPNAPTMRIQRLENGVHEFIWTAANSEQVDTWFEYNKRLYETTPADTVLRFFHTIEMRQAPPLHQVMRRAQVLQMLHPVRANTRSVLLIESSLIATFINTLSRMLNVSGKDTTKFFLKNEREKAMRWLLSDDTF